MTEFCETGRNQAPQLWNPSNYAEALQQGFPVEIPMEAGIRGRILRGRTQDDFDTLGSPDRDIVFIMGPDGLSVMPGMEPLAALDRVGLTPGYVHGRINQGYHFKLLVFEGGDAAPLATWDNALNMVAACHPELAGDIDQHREALKVTPFATFEEDVSEPLDEIELAGPAHPEYMSLERFRSLLVAERNNPAKLRRLLFHVEHLGTLFYGDGYTRTTDGQVGLAEYLVPNGRIDSLQDAVVVDLF